MDIPTNVCIQVETGDFYDIITYVHYIIYECYTKYV